MTSEERDRLIATVFIARIIPLIIFAIVVYGCWVFTQTLCVEWLIDPAHEADPSYPAPRPATAIGLIVLYYVTLVPFLLTYAILFVKVVWNQDFVEYGPDHESRRDSPTAASSLTRLAGASSSAVSGPVPGGEAKCEADVEHGSDHDATHRLSYPQDPAGYEAFYMKDVYCCLDDGRPPWCSVCCQFKTDRTHHCKEVNRCVRKMDHFCPWVGGVVSESTFKQFIQFLAYASLFVIVNFAIFVSYTVARHKAIGGYNVHYLIGIGVYDSSGSTIAHTIAFPMSNDPKFAAQNMPLLRAETRTFLVVQTDKGVNPWDLGILVRITADLAVLTRWDGLCRNSKLDMGLM
ncbi:palmitoyltransferase pfa5, partial [Ascosphaera acerosa]